MYYGVPMVANPDLEVMNRLRRQVLLMSARSGEGHVPSALSILDLLYVIYDKLIQTPAANFEKSDKFILSKGHASLGLYVILAETGHFPTEWLETFGEFKSNLGGHPDTNKIPGVHASTGSLGHGLPIALGMALANKIKGKNSRVIALVGDGEMNEGSVWESLLLASHHELGNLTMVIDANDSTNRALSLGDLKRKLEAFGWQVSEIDGHSHGEILKALLSYTTKVPTAIIARTVKGFGIKEMENNPAWHHASPNTDQLAGFLKGLK